VAAPTWAEHPMKLMRPFPLLVLYCAVVSACSGPHSAVTTAVPTAGRTAPAYALENTEVREISSKSLGRDYELFVSLPENYREYPTKLFPVLFITDANYAFPLVRSIARRVGDHGRGLEQFVLVGLSYAKGDTPEYSRRRDYTPTANGDKNAVSDMPGKPPVYGGGEAYRRFIVDEVFPFVARTYRVDMKRKIYAGHSYGGLFGIYILLTEPTMFEGYIISSPSLWFDGKVSLARERDYALAHKDLAANAFLVVGAYETINSNSGDRRYNRTFDLVRDLKELETQLRGRHYPGLRVESQVLADEDHLTVYPSAITRGLMWAFPAVKQ
jgi:predicted alpha/beta superfamily hydrolase